MLTKQTASANPRLLF